MGLKCGPFPIAAAVVVGQAVTKARKRTLEE